MSDELVVTQEQEQELISPDERQWAMFMHLSLLLGFTMAGLIIPIVIWQLKKDVSAFVDDQGREVLNFIINMFLAMIVVIALCLLLVGFLLLPVFGILVIVFPIIGAIKANDGVRYRYPIVLWRPI